MSLNSTNSTGTPPPMQKSGAVAAGSGLPKGWTPAMENDALSHYLLFICAVVSGAFIVWKIWTEVTKYVRTVTGLTNDTQYYFAKASGKVSWFKKNILYSPLFNKRHNREFQLSSAVNMGTLPTRFQFLFLLGYLSTNVAFCVIDIPWDGDYTSAGKQLRNRSGTLAVVNMVGASQVESSQFMRVSR